MIGDYDPRRQDARQQDAQPQATRRLFPPRLQTPPHPEMSASGEPRASGLRRFLGGSPTTVLVKLAFLSVVVGAAMAMLGLTPGILFWRLYDAARWLIDAGLAAFDDFGQWILAGAVVVVPLWLVSRLLAMGR